MGSDAHEMGLWGMGNVVLILFTVMKIMSLLRIYPKVGNFVKLIQMVFIDSMMFTTFFVGWIYVFSLMFQAVGIAINDEDYPEITNSWKYGLYSYRNSIGDINPPGYEYWIKNLPDERYPTMARTMIIVVWVVWWFNQFFMLIIMLNFLITIIGNSFNRVMDSSKVNTYRFISQLNYNN